MKKFKFLLGVVLAFICTAQAEDLSPKSGSKSSYGLINQGDALVDGNFVIQTNAGRTQRTSIELNSSFQYFVADRLAIGPQFGFAKVGGYNGSGTVGVRGTWYVFSQERIAVPIALSTGIGLGANTFDTYFGPTVGCEYFVSPSISFGPFVQYLWHKFANDNWSYLKTGFLFRKFI